MAKKSVTAQTPKNTDVLKINDIINQKIDIPAGHQLTYFPITGAVASSSVANQGPLLVLDTSPDTYWQPSDQVAGAHIELQTPNPYECYGVDIKFKESEGKKFNLKVDILDKEHNRWLTIATAESSLIDDNKYERFHAAQHFKSDTYRVIINSVFDTATNSIYTQPKITQVRLFGLVPDADVAKYKVVEDQECPEGYGKDTGSGQCVKLIPSEIIKPKTVDAHSAVDMGKDEPAGNDPENLLSVNPNDKLTLKGVGSTIEYSLSRTDAVYGVYIHKLNNPPRQYTLLTAFYNGQDKQPFYSFVVDIPDSQDKYVHILNQPIRADRFVLSVVDNTEPNQWFSLFGLYLIGQPNAGPESPEPEDKGRVKDWGSVDTNPNNWKVVSMKDDKTKFKVVDKDNVNVADNFNTKKGAQKFIDDAIANYKPTEPPVEPPVEPPTQPPIDPNAKVDAQGVVMIYAPKAGGQIVIAKETNEKQSEHNTGKRSSLYSNKPYSANSGELTVGFRMNLSDNGEQCAPKLLSGGHTGSGDNDETRQGQCYAVGLNQNGSLHLAKEYPYHPKTPKAYDQIKYLNPNWKSLGSVKDKKVWMKIIYFPVIKDGKTGMHIEWWFDKKGFETQKLENDFQQMAYAEDFGDWGSKFGPPILENSGVKYKGKILGFYCRVDTPTKPVEFFNQGQHELDSPPRKLIGTAPTAAAAPQTVTGKTIAAPKK
jgi:hypothetical protein